MNLLKLFRDSPEFGTLKHLLLTFRYRDFDYSLRIPQWTDERKKATGRRNKCHQRAYSDVNH